MGLEYQEDVVPPECALITQLVETFNPGSSPPIGALDRKSHSPCERLNYIGQLHFRDGQIHTDLRCAFLSLSEKEYSSVRLM